MARLVFFMSPAYGKNFARILSVVNKSRPKGQEFRDITEWERTVIRSYLQMGMTGYRRWEVEGEITDRRNNKAYPLLEDGAGEPLAVNMAPRKLKTFKRVLVLPDRQLELLKKTILFYRSIDRVVSKAEKGIVPLFESQAGSVGEFVGRMLADAYSGDAALQDIAETL